MSFETIIVFILGIILGMIFMTVIYNGFLHGYPVFLKGLIRMVKEEKNRKIIVTTKENESWAFLKELNVK